MGIISEIIMIFTRDRKNAKKRRGVQIFLIDIPQERMAVISWKELIFLQLTKAAIRQDTGRAIGRIKGI